MTRITRLPVCEQCLESIQPIHGPTCGVCGERIASPHFEAEMVCGQCRQEQPLFARAMAYGSYQGGLRELIHLLKYERVRPAAKVLGRMLGEVIEGLGEDFDSAVVVAVPLHASKLRYRGFNQAEEIARAALKAGAPRLVQAAHVLERKRDTESQTGLSDHQRRENVRGAFVVGDAAAVAGRDVLLVDDVFTTGATASECARVLRRAGAGRVFVATVARVLKFEAAGAVGEEQAESKVLKAYA